MVASSLSHSQVLAHLTDADAQMHAAILAGDAAEAGRLWAIVRTLVAAEAVAA